MDDVADQLERCAVEQAAAIRTLTTAYRQPQQQQQSQEQGGSTAGNSKGNLPSSVLDSHVQQAHECVVATATRMQTLVATPAQFLQRLANESQILASLQWLCEFQVLACIPLHGAVPFDDVAFLAHVPAPQLRRVARFMVTVGFLREPHHDHVAHTSMSSPFVSEPGLFDAALFLSRTVALAALSLPEATRRFPESQSPDDSAFHVAFPACPTTMARPRLQTQWHAYLEHGTSDEEVATRDVLFMVDWKGLGPAVVADVGAPSLAASLALAEQLPLIQFVVQPDNTNNSLHNSSNNHKSNNSNSDDGGDGSTHMASWPSNATVDQREAGVPYRVSVQQRPRGTLQFITDAAVYIIRLSSPSPIITPRDIVNQAAIELSAHMDVLRTNPLSRVLLLLRVLPKPGSVDVDTELSARARDLSLLQLVNGREVELEEVVEILEAVRDYAGGLVLTGELRSPRSSMVALEIRYQTHAATDRHDGRRRSPAPKASRQQSRGAELVHL